MGNLSFPGLASAGLGETDAHPYTSSLASPTLLPGLDGYVRAGVAAVADSVPQGREAPWAVDGEGHRSGG